MTTHQRHWFGFFWRMERNRLVTQKTSTQRATLSSCLYFTTTPQGNRMVARGSPWYWRAPAQWRGQNDRIRMSHFPTPSAISDPRSHPRRLLASQKESLPGTVCLPMGTHRTAVDFSCQNNEREDGMAKLIKRYPRDYNQQNLEYGELCDITDKLQRS